MVITSTSPSTPTPFSKSVGHTSLTPSGGSPTSIAPAPVVPHSKPLSSGIASRPRALSSTALPAASSPTHHATRPERSYSVVERPPTWSQRRPRSHSLAMPPPRSRTPSGPFTPEESDDDDDDDDSSEEEDNRHGDDHTNAVSIPVPVPPLTQQSHSAPYGVVAGAGAAASAGAGAGGPATAASAPSASSSFLLAQHLRPPVGSVASPMPAPPMPVPPPAPAPNRRRAQSDGNILLHARRRLGASPPTTGGGGGGGAAASAAAPSPAASLSPSPSPSPAPPASFSPSSSPSFASPPSSHHPHPQPRRSSLSGVTTPVAAPAAPSPPAPPRRVPIPSHPTELQTLLMSAADLYAKAVQLKSGREGTVDDVRSMLLAHNSPEAGVKAALRAQATFVECLGPTHAGVASASKLLGCLYVQCKNHASALENFKFAARVCTHQFGPDAVVTADVLFNIGMLYSMMGDHEGALNTLSKVYEVYSRHRGEHDPLTLRVKGKLNDTMRCNTELQFTTSFSTGLEAFSEGNIPRAAAAFASCLKLVPNDPQTAYQIAACHCRMDRVDGALEWLGRAASWGFSDWDSATTDDDLAPLREHLGRDGWAAAVAGAGVLRATPLPAAAPAAAVGGVGGSAMPEEDDADM